MSGSSERRTVCTPALTMSTNEQVESSTMSSEELQAANEYVERLVLRVQRSWRQYQWQSALDEYAACTNAAPSAASRWLAVADAHATMGSPCALS